jgi:hypothetical protein
VRLVALCVFILSHGPAVAELSVIAITPRPSRAARGAPFARLLFSRAGPTMAATSLSRPISSTLSADQSRSDEPGPFYDTMSAGTNRTRQRRIEASRQISAGGVGV